MIERSPACRSASVSGGPKALSFYQTRFGEQDQAPELIDAGRFVCNMRMLLFLDNGQRTDD